MTFYVPLVAAAAALVFASVGTAAAAAQLNFEQTLQGVKFTATSPNNASLNTLTLVATVGDVTLLKEAVEIDGTINAATGIELADLDANGFPEIYIYANSAGSGSYGSVTAYASNRNKSMTPVYLQPLEQDEVLAKGYMGHDEFTVGEGALLRRFPIYLDGDTNATPTGGLRQVQYRLEAGEATWTLTPYEAHDY